MDFEKFLQENKKAISELAKRNSKYDAQGHALLTKEEIEEAVSYTHLTLPTT